jgi:MFS family permease
MTAISRMPIADPGKVLLPLGLGTALSLMGDATLYAVLPTHTADAGITLAGVGVILGVNRAIRLVTNGPTGLAYDRWPRRSLFVPALLIGALSTAMYAATRGFWPLLLGRLLWGLAWSGIWVGGATMILDVTTPANRGRWTGLYQTWFFLGTALGSLAGGVLTDLLGYAMTMWVGALVTAGGCAAAALLLPETRPPTPSHRSLASAVAASVPLRANGPLLAAVALQAVNRFAISGVLSATLALVVQQRVADLPIAVGAASATGILLAGRTIFSMAAAPLCGSLSDRLGSRWGVFAWTIGAGLVGFVFLAWGNLAGVLAGVVLTALANGGMQAMSTTLTGDLVSPAQRGRAIGLLHTAGDAGSAVGPPLAYVLMPLVSLGGVYVACAVLCLAGVLLAAHFHVRPGHHEVLRLGCTLCC